MACCKPMEYALTEGYLHKRLQADVTEGKINVLPPAIEGPTLTRSGKKRKPILILHLCPWCGAILDQPNNEIKLTRSELTRTEGDSSDKPDAVPSDV
jgi:hypothetical protein